MDPIYRTKLRALLIRHESLRLMPYTDQTGHLTIGVGRSLSTRGISEAEAFILLDDDMLYFTDKLTLAFPWFSDLGQNRQIALIDMAFNLGFNGLCEFKNMLGALEKGDFNLASIYLMQSKAATQDPQRYHDLANILKTDEIS